MNFQNDVFGSANLKQVPVLLHQNVVVTQVVKVREISSSWIKNRWLWLSGAELTTFPPTLSLLLLLRNRIKSHYFWLCRWEKEQSAFTKSKQVCSCRFMLNFHVPPLVWSVNNCNLFVAMCSIAFFFCNFYFCYKYTVAFTYTTLPKPQQPTCPMQIPKAQRFEWWVARKIERKRWIPFLSVCVCLSVLSVWGFNVLLYSLYTELPFLSIGEPCITVN